MRRGWEKDAEAIAFLNATESTGLQLGLDSYRAPWKIICIRTAFKEYKTYGADLYKEALSMLARGWEGDREHPPPQLCFRAVPEAAGEKRSAPHPLSRSAP